MRFRALLPVSAFSILIAYSVGCNNKIFTETPTYPSVCEYISSLPIVEVFSRLLLNRLQAKERVVLSACVPAFTGRLRSFFLGTQSRCNKTSAPSKEGVNIYLCTTDIYASVETAQALIKPHAESSFWHEKVASEPPISIRIFLIPTRCEFSRTAFISYSVHRMFHHRTDARTVAFS
ncbi:hypothetical protein SprV_0902659200 [Sparganum proliferum]